MNSKSETISKVVVEAILKEHNFKKNMLFAMVNRIISIIDDSDEEERQARFQALVPTIEGIIETSIKNDQQLLKLLEVVKKHGTSIDDDLDDDDFHEDELMEIISNASEDTKELEEKIKKNLNE